MFTHLMERWNAWYDAWGVTFITGYVGVQVLILCVLVWIAWRNPRRDDPED